MSRFLSVNQRLKFVAIMLLFSLLGTQTASLAKVSADVYKKAFAAYQLGDYKKLFDYLAKDDDVQSILLLGNALQEESMDNSIDYFLRVQKLSPFNVEAIVGHAAFALKRRRFKETSDTANAVFSQHPDNAEALSLLGRCLFISGRVKEGFTAMTKALAMEPKSTEICQNLVDSYCDEVEFDKAEALLNRLVAANPRRPLALLRRAHFFTAQGKPDRSMADCALALAINPTYQPALLERAHLFFNKGEYAKALSPATAAIDAVHVECFLSAALRMRIRCEHKLGRTADAIKDLNVYLKDAPHLNSISNGTRDSILERAHDYESLKKYAEALRDVLFVRKYFPKSNDATVFAARLYSEMGNLPKSLLELNHLIEVDKSVPEWHRLRAEVLKKLGKTKEAEADLAAAKQLESHL